LTPVNLNKSSYSDEEVEEMIREAQHLWYAVYVANCYSTNDVRDLDALIDKLDEIGYECIKTIQFAPRTEDDLEFKLNYTVRVPDNTFTGFNAEYNGEEGTIIEVYPTGFIYAYMVRFSDGKDIGFKEDELDYA